MKLKIGQKYLIKLDDYQGEWFYFGKSDFVDEYRCDSCGRTHSKVHFFTKEFYGTDDENSGKSWDSGYLYLGTTCIKKCVVMEVK